MSVCPYPETLDVLLLLDWWMSRAHHDYRDDQLELIYKLAKRINAAFNLKLNAAGLKPVCIQSGSL